MEAVLWLRYVDDDIQINCRKHILTEIEICGSQSWNNILSSLEKLHVPFCNIVKILIKKKLIFFIG